MTTRAWQFLLIVVMSAACAPDGDNVGPEGSIRFHIQSLLQKPLPEIVWETRDAERLFADLLELYESRDFEPIWVDESGMAERGETVIDVLRRAHEHGLRPGDYLLRMLADENYPDDLSEVDAEVQAAVDLSLSFTTMRFIKDLDEGRFPPTELKVGDDLGHEPKDLSDELNNVATSSSTEAALDGYAPRFAAYRALQEALVRYREIAESDPWHVVAADETLHPGERYDDIDRLRQRLQLTGDLAADAPSEGLVYEGALVEAMKRFQIRHSLNPEGVVGEHTFADVNTSWNDRAAQIAASMERLRWLPDSVEGTPILANLPEFRLHAGSLDGDDFDVSFRSRIIVGKAYHRFRTPLFTGKLSYIDFRPFWNVPMSIIRNEISHRLDEPGYLDQRGYEIVETTALDARPLDVTPETLRDVRTGRLRLRQRPGPGNALGLVKFIFPNEHSVFLHSTPSQGLFQTEERAYSHGCVRVGDPVGLAEWILSGQGEWDKAAIEQAMASGPTTRVPVERDVPVFIMYLTAYVSAATGELHFGHDVYGLDTELAHALGHDYAEIDVEPIRFSPERLQ